jgi:RecA-family ATPase
MIDFKPIRVGENKSFYQLSNEEKELLVIRSANQCVLDAHQRPVPQRLFAEFWHEGEICILFADSNLGKSILAVQIADSISGGRPIPGFPLNAQKQSVLYFDFEMSDKQFEKRYSIDYNLHYVFDENFKRVLINPDCSDFDHFEQRLFHSIEKAVEETGTRILIIDNLTYLKTQSTDTAKEALPLMKELKKLAGKYSLSILALAHTPKRSHQNPITMNDLAGSKQLSNFADSVFAIGPSSQDKSLRYIKQIKARATEVKYDSENVVLCEIGMDYNRLIFQFREFTEERLHLRQKSEEEASELERQIIELRQSQNLSYGKIAEALGTNKMRVKRILDRQGFVSEQ